MRNFGFTNVRRVATGYTCGVVASDGRAVLVWSAPHNTRNGATVRAYLLARDTLKV